MAQNIWLGEKVYVRLIEERDADAPYFQVGRGHDSESDRLYDLVDVQPTPERMRREIQDAAQRRQQDDAYWFVIEDARGEVVGKMITYQCHKRMGTFRYGIDIARAHRRKGYAREALTILLRFFFLELGYQKVNTGVSDFNDASIAFHESYGFVLEGVFRSMVYSQGAHHDEQQYGMTREEFVARYS